MVAVSAALMFNAAGDPFAAPLLASVALVSLTTLILYFWSADLIGRSWALLPAFLFAFSPLVLRAASSVDARTIETLALLAALFAFLHFLLHPQRRHLIAAIFILGIAAFASDHSIFLIPHFILLTLVFYLASVGRDWQITPPPARGKRFGIRALRYFRALFVILIGGHIIAAVAFLALGIAPSDIGRAFVTRLARIKPPSFPAEILGQPFPFLVLFAIAALMALWRTIISFFKSLFSREPLFLDYLGTHFTEFALLVFAALVLAFGAPLLPALPSLAILVASSIRNTIRIRHSKGSPLLLKLVIVYRELFGISVKSLVLAALLAWYFVSAVTAL